MGSLNRTILTGRLTRDPEISYVSSEIPVARFSLAVSKNAKNKENTVDFINCVAWRGLAKICKEYLKKGRLIAVEGRLQIKSFNNKNGEKKTAAEVVASNIQMLDNKFYQATLKDKEDLEEEVNLLTK
jgi:single-strand DNA-binding protein